MVSTWMRFHHQPEPMALLAAAIGASRQQLTTQDDTSTIANTAGRERMNSSNRYF
jgi:hypothetical protein